MTARVNTVMLLATTLLAIIALRSQGTLVAGMTPRRNQDPRTNQDPPAGMLVAPRPTGLRQVEADEVTPQSTWRTSLHPQELRAELYDWRAKVVEAEVYQQMLMEKYPSTYFNVHGERTFIGGTIGGIVGGIVGGVGRKKKTMAARLKVVQRRAAPRVLHVSWELLAQEALFHSATAPAIIQLTAVHKRGAQVQLAELTSSSLLEPMVVELGEGIVADYAETKGVALQLELFYEPPSLGFPSSTRTRQSLAKLQLHRSTSSAAALFSHPFLVFPQPNPTVLRDRVRAKMLEFARTMDQDLYQGFPILSLQRLPGSYRPEWERMEYLRRLVYEEMCAQVKKVTLQAMHNEQYGKKYFDESGVAVFQGKPSSKATMTIRQSALHPSQLDVSWQIHDKTMILGNSQLVATLQGRLLGGGETAQYLAPRHALLWDSSVHVRLTDDEVNAFQRGSATRYLEFQLTYDPLDPHAHAHSSTTSTASNTFTTPTDSQVVLATIELDGSKPAMVSRRRRFQVFPEVNLVQLEARMHEEIKVWHKQGRIPGALLSYAGEMRAKNLPFQGGVEQQQVVVENVGRSSMDVPVTPKAQPESTGPVLAPLQEQAPLAKVEEEEQWSGELILPLRLHHQQQQQQHIATLASPRV